jgi:HEAT repeat protein
LRLRLSLLLLAPLLVGACEDRSYREIGANIDVLTKRSNDLPSQAVARLARLGRRAVPQIETAMHTASPRGKANLVSALAAIGDPEAAAILQHFATYDLSPEVRATCEGLLHEWAAENGPRGAPARQALARVAEKRSLGQAE